MHIFTIYPLLLLIWAFSNASWALELDKSKFAPINGYGNNLNSAAWGSSSNGLFYSAPELLQQRPDINSSPAAMLAGLERPDLPAAINASLIASSNLLSVKHPSSPFSAFAMHFAQILFHDIALVERQSTSIGITVPTCDKVFDPLCTGNKRYAYFPLQVNVTNSGVNSYRNLVTAFVDASFIYGSNDDKLSQRRAANNGKLKMGLNNYLPLISGDSFLSRPGGISQRLLFDSGDSRANENAVVQLFHTIFAREHNRRASILAASNPFWDSDTIFYNARKWVVGIWQKFVFEDFIPTVLGIKLPEYTGYNSTINPSIPEILLAGPLQFFITSQLAYLELRKYDGSLAEAGLLSLSKTDHSTVDYITVGVESLLRGLITSRHALLAPRAASSIYRKANFDLTFMRDSLAELLLTDRNLGLLPYNFMSNKLGVSIISKMIELVSEIDFLPTISSLYSSIGKVEFSFGGLAHASTNGKPILPPSYKVAFERAFLALRDGDRFYYRSINTSYYSNEEIFEIGNFTWQNLISMNTLIENFPVNPFYVSDPVKVFGNAVKKQNDQLIKVTSKSNMVKVSSVFKFNWTIVEPKISLPYIKFDVYFERDNESKYAWAAIGLGNGLTDTDMFVMSFIENEVSVIDSWCQHYMPVPDVVYSNTARDNIFNVILRRTEHESIFNLSFSRLLYTYDATDVDISLTESQNVSWAYSRREKFPSYHDSIRGTLEINFGLGTSIRSSPVNNLATTEQGTKPVEVVYPPRIPTGFGPYFIWVHGVLMLLLFMGFIPVAVYMSRYMIENPYWLEIHEKLTTCCLSQFLIAIVSTLGNEELLKNSLHSSLGLILIAFIFICAIQGYVMRYMNEFLEMHPNVAYNLRLTHALWGYVVFGLGQYVCLVGILDLLRERFDYSELLIWYGLWVLGLMTAIAIGEYKMYLKSVLPYNPVAKAVYKSSMKKKYSHLPEFTWKDISERVLKGSLWVEIDYVFYNVAQYAQNHPGGSHFLFQAIGTDASSLFDASIKDLELLQYLKGSEKSENGNAALQSSLSLSGGDDEAAEATFSNVPKFRLAENVHTHSKLAMLKMESLAVGTLDGSEINSEVTHISDRIQKDFFQPITNPGIWPYRACILSIYSKKQVSGADARTIVINLKLKFASDTDVAQFFPGDYVLLQHVSKSGLIISRAYTPIRQYAVGEVSFLIKLYPDGEFCRLLAKMSEGECLIARGPIPGKNELISLNDSYGCYSAVGMIVAGTGLTPALLLIDHYMRYGSRDNSDILQHQLSVIFVNTAEEDIFYKKELEDLVIDSRGALRVFFCVKEPGGDWNGFSGMVNEDMIRESMPAPNYRAVKNTNANRNMAGDSADSRGTPSTPTNVGGQKGGASRGSLMGRSRGGLAPVTSGAVGDSNTALGTGGPGGNSKNNRASNGSIVRLDTNNMGSVAASTFLTGGAVGSSRASLSIRKRSIVGDSTSSKIRTAAAIFSDSEESFKIMVCGSASFNTSILDLLTKMGYKRNQLEVLG